MDAPLRLTVPAGAAGVAQAHAALAGWFAPGVSARSRHAADLVVEEVLMNVAMHGGGGEVALAALATPGAGGEPGVLTLRFDDDGPDFDPVAAPALAAPASLAEARVGGLGLALVRRFATALRHTRLPAGNRLEVELALR